MNVGMTRSLPLLAALASLAWSSATLAAPPDDAVAKRPCAVEARGCVKYKHLLTYPAHSLSFGNGTFTLHPRGVNWADNTGAMTLTLRRPPDYNGGKVRLTLFHQVLSDEAGDIVFHLTPMTFNHGNSFETYGAISTNTLQAPMTLTILLQQSAVIEPGNGWNADGDWWYLEIGRAGTYHQGLRLMSVAVEY
jgi:hypothetical protein